MGSLLFGKDRFPGPADSGRFVNRVYPYWKVHLTDFFQDRKKIFISNNTLSESRIFHDAGGQYPLHLPVLPCFNNPAVRTDAFIISGSRRV
jgi:hypothetical protein